MPSIQEELLQEWGSAAFQEAREPYRDGFNMKSVIGGLFLAFVMLPGAIYLTLVAGSEQGMHTAAQWVTVILFTEVSRRCFTRLTRQEIVVLFALAGGLVVSGGPFFQILWNQFLVQSIQAEQFGIVGELSQNPWIAPPRGSPVYLLRTIFSREWLPAIGVIVLSGLLGRIVMFCLGYTLFRITSDVEQLPFPMAPIAAQGATALAESYEPKETWRWRVFTTGTAIGIVFGIVYVVLPTITGGIMNKPVQILPIPFIDLTQKTQGILPAALVGLGTNLLFILIGFVLPFRLVIGATIASIGTMIVLNPILYNHDILTSWKPGMDTIQTYIANDLDLWMSIRIGTTLTIAFIGIGSAAHALLRRGEKRKIQRGSKERGDIPVLLAVGVWLTAALSLVYLCHRLVPTFPWWLLVFYALVWTPFNSYISARMVGLTGQPVQFSYFREASFILSTRMLGYNGIAIWFAPVPLADYGWMTQTFRELTLTRTKFTSLIKVELLIFPLLLITSVLFCSFLWKLNQIPSAAYPYAAKMWGIQAYWQCLWATGTRTGNSLLFDAIKPGYIALGLGGGLGLYALFMIFNGPLFLFYGLLTGIGAWPHNQVLLFAGALLGHYVFQPRFGRDKWRRYVPVLTAGATCGLGLTGMLAIGFTLISKSVIQLPY